MSIKYTSFSQLIFLKSDDEIFVRSVSIGNMNIDNKTRFYIKKNGFQEKQKKLKHYPKFKYSILLGHDLGG